MEWDDLAGLTDQCGLGDVWEELEHCTSAELRFVQPPVADLDDIVEYGEEDGAHEQQGATAEGRYQAGGTHPGDDMAPVELRRDQDEGMSGMDVDAMQAPAKWNA
eukprot:gene18163-63670_t